MGDLHLNQNGDLEVEASGDLKGVDNLEEDLQTLAFRIKTGPGELVLHPEVGAALAQLIGEPVTAETIARGEALILSAATSNGTFSPGEVSVRGVPMRSAENSAPSVVAFVIEIVRGRQEATFVVPFDFALGRVVETPTYLEAVGENDYFGVL